MRSLERTWDSDLAVLYAQVPHRRLHAPARDRGTLARQRTARIRDLLYALGRLCERESLWGKAQTYFEASLALDDHWRTHVALGELHARLGRTELANTHLAAALERSLAELGRPGRAAHSTRAL